MFELKSSNSFLSSLFTPITIPFILEDEDKIKELSIKQEKINPTKDLIHNEDKELMDILFNKTKNTIDSTPKQSKNFCKSNKNLIERMKDFLDKKNEKIKNVIELEKSMHNPILTFKGYMQKSRSVDTMINQPIRSKTEKLLILKKQIEKQELSELTCRPKINRKTKFSESKLGIGMPLKDYINILRNKDINKKQELFFKNKFKEEDELKECTHKPIINKIYSKKNNLILQKKEKSPKKYCNIQHKKKETIINNINNKENQKNNENQPNTIYNDKMNKIKKEIQSLLKQ